MKSRPASSAIRASARQSSQLADQRSGTLVAERPDEQLAPNRPILSALPLYMAMRFCIEAAGASTSFSVVILWWHLSVIPGPSEARGPESIVTIVAGVADASNSPSNDRYGLRARGLAPAPRNDALIPHIDLTHQIEHRRGRCVKPVDQRLHFRAAHPIDVEIGLLGVGEQCRIGHHGVERGSQFAH